MGELRTNGGLAGRSRIGAMRRLFPIGSLVFGPTGGLNPTCAFPMPGATKAARKVMTKSLLLSLKTCPGAQRPAIVLREKNIAFEFRHIDRDNRPDWFLAISPHKKVPVLSIDGKVSL